LFDDGFHAPCDIGIEDINFAAGTASEQVIAGSADQDIIEGVTVEFVIARAACDILDVVLEYECEVAVYILRGIEGFKVNDESRSGVSEIESVGAAVSGYGYGIER
jgi:hypothetical protein